MRLGAKLKWELLNRVANTLRASIKLERWSISITGVLGFYSLSKQVVLPFEQTVTLEFISTGKEDNEEALKRKTLQILTIYHRLKTNSLSNPRRTRFHQVRWVLHDMQERSFILFSDKIMNKWGINSQTLQPAESSLYLLVTVLFFLRFATALRTLVTIFRVKIFELALVTVKSAASHY